MGTPDARDRQAAYRGVDDRLGDCNDRHRHRGDLSHLQRRSDLDRAGERDGESALVDIVYRFTDRERLGRWRYHPAYDRWGAELDPDTAWDDRGAHRCLVHRCPQRDRRRNRGIDSSYHQCRIRVDSSESRRAL